MIGRAGLRGLMASVAFLAAATAFADEHPRRAQTAGTVSGPSLYTIQSLANHVAVTPVTEVAGVVGTETTEFWRQRWQDDRDTIARLRLEAQRNGPVLSLRLDGNRIIRFVDEVGTCAGFFTCISHTVHDYMADHAYYVLSVGHGEGGWAYLVSRRTGEVIDLVAAPVLSRDRKLALAWYPSLAEGPKLDVLHFNGDKVAVEEGIVEGVCWKRAAEWSDALIPNQVDAETIAWMRISSGGSDEPSGVMLKRIDGSWHVTCDR